MVYEWTEPSRMPVSAEVVSNSPTGATEDPDSTGADLESNPSAVITAMALSIVTSLTVVHELAERLAITVDAELPNDLELAGEQVIADLEQALAAIRVVLGAIEGATATVHRLRGTPAHRSR